MNFRFMWKASVFREIMCLTKLLFFCFVLCISAEDAGIYKVLFCAAISLLDLAFEKMCTKISKYA